MNELARAWGSILRFPRYFLGFLLGFVVIVLEELDMTALLLAAIALGVVTSVYWAVFFFLVAWVAFRALSALVMIGQAIQFLAGALRERP